MNANGMKARGSCGRKCGSERIDGDSAFAWARQSVDAARLRSPALWAIGVAIVLGGLVAALMTVDVKSFAWISSAVHLALGILFLANVRWLERAHELPARIMDRHPYLAPTAVLASIAVWLATYDAAPGVATGALVLGVASIGFFIFWAWSVLWMMALEDLKNRQVLRFVGTVALAGLVQVGLAMLW